ncbi:bifunctional heptose 7-phosphate kinase/heptose 1-phosphate adenyltransferase [Gloeocapsa sp. PCC 73106]|uniref:bifunctional heptose 7-phosphate kinase/heptose 1-phosphate adenyltransferase n=1 Tax=Gloeocapsa sp. PCC 73106 TaxID=102232 RepID=UPI0002AC75D3|nr:PfkB family carbohydrate kinase [Gloeocapsa sp. PCC 73106]ELR99673.1 ADP-heptose synthase, bifunctional sugar kinase/adenylyltransferase [Gloeocapsa sp. PCC 73106]
MSLSPNFTTRLTQSVPRLEQLLERFSGQSILVIGDLTLDEFMTGQVERISREAPVLILRHEETRQIPGGGANAVYNLAKLGAKVTVVGILGQDAQGKALKSIFTEAGIDTTGIISTPSRPTVTKTRIAGHARQSVTQQIVRVDRKSDEIPPLEIQNQLAAFIQQQSSLFKAIVCSDYGDGVFTTPVIQAASQHQRVIVDTQTDLDRFTGATLFTPNLPEAEQAVGYPIKDSISLQRAGEDLLKLTQASQILITRGEEGMSLFNATESEHIPAFNRTDVFDVTGAGDTVVAALTLALGAGGSFWESAVLGNLAASIVVRQFGTATTTVAEMKQALSKLLKS